MNSTILIHVASRAETRLTHRQAATSGAGTPYCISCNGTVKLTHCKLRQPQISLVKLRLNTRWGGLDPCQPVNLTMPKNGLVTTTYPLKKTHATALAQSSILKFSLKSNFAAEPLSVM